MAQHNRAAELAIISFIMQSETLITGATIKILLIQLRSTKESILFLLIQFKPHYSSYRPFVSPTRRLGCWMFWAGAAVEMRYVPLMLIAWDVNKDLDRDDNRKKSNGSHTQKINFVLKAVSARSANWLASPLHSPRSLTRDFCTIILVNQHVTLLPPFSALFCLLCTSLKVNASSSATSVVNTSR